MAVITGMVLGGTVGLVAGGVTVAGRAMAVGNGFPMARFVGFAAENRGEVLQLGPLERGALAKSTRRAENVRFWHKADMLNALTNVRYRG